MPAYDLPTFSTACDRAFIRRNIAKQRHAEPAEALSVSPKNGLRRELINAPGQTTYESLGSDEMLRRMKYYKDMVHLTVKTPRLNIGALDLPMISRGRFLKEGNAWEIQLRR